MRRLMIVALVVVGLGSVGHAQCYWTGAGCIYPVTSGAGSVAQAIQQVMEQERLATLAANQPPTQPASTAPPLWVFGGPNHGTFLGCLSCPAADTTSISNTTGLYGSSVGAASITNHLSPYGNAISPYSACNPIAPDPPVIVDPQGGFHGRLTVNLGNRERAREDTINVWIRQVCGL